MHTTLRGFAFVWEFGNISFTLKTKVEMSNQVEGQSVSPNDAKPDVRRILSVGAKLKIYFNPKNINNMELEVRAIVDDSYVVFVTKKGNYKMESIQYFNMLYKDGSLSCA